LFARPFTLLALAWALAGASPPAAGASPTGGLGGDAAEVIGDEDAAILLSTLSNAPSQGFEANEFDPAPAAALLGSADPVLHSRGEQLLAAAAVAYARAQHGERLEGRFPGNWAIRPAAYDGTADFNAALEDHRIADWVATLPPPDQRYQRLVLAYARYQAIAANGGWRSVATSVSLKPGATGRAVEALRQRLAAEDPTIAAMEQAAGSHASGVAPPASYDAVLAAAVSRAQVRYGLGASGVANAATIAALNVPVDRRLAQITANLERWRWSPRNLPPYRVELNIAEASLALYNAGAPALEMRVIVGRPSKQTPMFEDGIKAVVFNPPWNVPVDIAATEVWPRIRRDPGYMAREGYVVRPDGGLQQLPGPQCALGNIKFDLSNPFGVYLHDTPSRSLFARDSRALSHGCMRLEKPNVLAKRLLAGDPAWPETRIDFAIAGGKTVRAPLMTPVPLYVFYWTAFVDDDGQVEFRQDVYRWDERLLSLLARRR
jgi:murein L,D-transpeptidase YcbB/YkuD